MAPGHSGSMEHLELTAGHEGTDNPKQTGFFKLPPELRNRIYTLALVEVELIQIDPSFIIPGVLQASRKLRSETVYL